MRTDRVIVIGASSGIGAGLVKVLAQRGSQVAAVARRRPELEALAEECEGQVTAYVHDVRQLDEVPLLFDEIAAKLGGVDLVVYAAGVMPEIEEGEYNTAKDEQMLRVNLMGAIAWLNLAAARMEQQGKGAIVGISSVAGDRGRRGNPVYTASKAGLNAYLEALRNRVSRYGVNVVTVKPGPVDTPMTAGSPQPLIISTERCVQGILRLVDQDRPVTGYVPRIWGIIMWLIRGVPSFLFRRTNI